MLCLNKETSLGSQTSMWQAARALVILSMAGNYPLSDTQAIQLQCGEVISFLGSTFTERLNSLCTKFVIFLFLQQTQMFSKAGLEDKRKKSIKFLRQTHTQINMTPDGNKQASGVLGKSMSLAPTHYPVPSSPLPSPGSAQGWEGWCQRGHEHCHSRLLGLLRTERGNNDSALSKQLPVVLKLLPT